MSVATECCGVIIEMSTLRIRGEIGWWCFTIFDIVFLTVPRVRNIERNIGMHYERMYLRYEESMIVDFANVAKKTSFE